jgi:translation initiation factor IF-1
MGKINTIRKVIKIANSSGITIDKQTTNSLKIKPGDYVQISLTTLQKRRQK